MVNQNDLVRISVDPSLFIPTGQWTVQFTSQTKVFWLDVLAAIFSYWDLLIKGLILYTLLGIYLVLQLFLLRTSKIFLRLNVLIFFAIWG